MGKRAGSRGLGRQRVGPCGPLERPAARLSLNERGRVATAVLGRADAITEPALDQAEPVHAPGLHDHGRVISTGLNDIDRVIPAFTDSRHMMGIADLAQREVKPVAHLLVKQLIVIADLRDRYQVIVPLLGHRLIGTAGGAVNHVAGTRLVDIDRVIEAILAAAD